VIGTIGSFTGPLSASTKNAEVVFEAWTAWTNAHGGINGHPVHLVTKDDLTDPAQALTEAHELVQSNHVLAVVDMESVVEASFSSYLQQSGVPVIGGNLADSEFGHNPDFFPEGTTNPNQTYGDLLGAKRAGAKKLAFAYCAESPACALAVPVVQKFGQELGLPVVYTAKVSSSAPDYTAQCLAAQSAGADAMDVGGATNTVTHLASDCARQGYTPRELGTDGSVTLSWLAAPGMNGAVMSQPDIPFFEKSSPALASMYSALEQYNPTALTASAGFGENAVYAWASGELFKAAALNANMGNNPTPSQLIAGLHSLSSETVGGLTPPLSFTGPGPYVVKCVFLMGISSGNWTTPFGTTAQCPSSTP
jgi:branched-chain amino acid transport system substrate-binding protein